MSIKGNLLEFCFEENGFKKTVAINLLNISHYYYNEGPDGNDYILKLFFTGKPEPEEFHGDIAGVIADTISEAMSNGKVYELSLEL